MRVESERPGLSDTSETEAGAWVLTQELAEPSSAPSVRSEDCFSANARWLDFMAGLVGVLITEVSVW